MEKTIFKILKVSSSKEVIVKFHDQIFKNPTQEIISISVRNSNRNKDLNPKSSFSKTLDNSTAQFFESCFSHCIIVKMQIMHFYIKMVIFFQAHLFVYAYIYLSFSVCNKCSLCFMNCQDLQCDAFFCITVKWAKVHYLFFSSTANCSHFFSYFQPKMVQR